MHIRLFTIKVQTSERGKGLSAYDIFVPLSSHDKKSLVKTGGLSLQSFRIPLFIQMLRLSFQT
jgi:hypothetical protein